jgi:hypothetical protein
MEAVRLLTPGGVMNRLLAMLLVLILGLPSAVSAVQPSGTLVAVPAGEADSGGEAPPRSWLANNIFIVRAHVCRTPGVPLCGPDPLVASSAAFGGVIRIWVPFPDTYTVYALVSDAEGNLTALAQSPLSIGGGMYRDFLAPFAPLPDGLYKFHTIVIASGSGLTTFSDFYQFRIGGPSSTGCCP